MHQSWRITTARILQQTLECRSTCYQKYRQLRHAPYYDILLSFFRKTCKQTKLGFGKA
jgi:hypothetical protein